MWLLTVAYFGQNVSGYGLVFFLPLIVKGLGVSTNWIGLVSALPYLCAFVAMIAGAGIPTSRASGPGTWPARAWWPRRGWRLHRHRRRSSGHDDGRADASH
jgi:hypothetical protein